MRFFPDDVADDAKGEDMNPEEGREESSFGRLGDLLRRKRKEQNTETIYGKEMEMVTYATKRGEN